MPQPIKFVACFAALATASIAQEPTARAQPKLDLSSYQIVYSSKRFSPPFNYAILFHELRARTSISRGLINSKDNCVSPYVSEDGKKIVYMIYTEGRNADIAIMSSEGKYARILTDNDDWDGFPALSRDGKRIIYTEKRQGVCRAIVMDTQGRYKRPVTPANYEVNCAIFSPDGNPSYFLARSRTTILTIMVNTKSIRFTDCIR